MSRRLGINSLPFELISKNKPAGDQGKTIKKLTEGLQAKKKDQVLLGVTGSGKTFTMANIINETQRPAIIMAHNKTLAAQLFSEMRSFFPKNAVEYFVSYYDHYQPEAYIAKTDTYIEKESVINKKIQILRHAATQSLMDRRDVIIVTSVSSIYGLGSPQHYKELAIQIEKNQEVQYETFLRHLIQLNYERNDINFDNGTFRVNGDVISIYPPYAEETAIRITFDGDKIENITEFNSLTQVKVEDLDKIKIYPSTHYSAPTETIKEITKEILKELKDYVKTLKQMGKNFEAHRIEQKTRYEIEMMLETGHCKGIENYSRYTDGRLAGEPPYTLFNYLPKDALVFVDESHATLPQIKGMFAGDLSRKQNLVSHGFRLPSALDNRPLRFEEWDQIRNQTIYVSATPGVIELEKTEGEVVEQIIRPTGLLDPICEVRPLQNHFDDLVKEIRSTSAKNLRTIIIVLTKKMAERTHEYLTEIGIRSMYIHSNTETIERLEIIQMLRKGEIEVIVGINLLREGIDIPECGLVAITDADKEGFLRSATSLIQIVGRAARNSAGKVIFYADKETRSMKKTISETNRRRKLQEEHNKKHNISPKNIVKPTSSVFYEIFEKKNNSKNQINEDQSFIDDPNILKAKMKDAAKRLDFETAIALQKRLEKIASSEYSPKKRKT